MDRHDSQSELISPEDEVSFEECVPNAQVPTSTEVPECRVYKRRWAILFLYMSFGVISSMSWIQYAIISNIIMRYYNVSSYAVDWTSMIFMLAFIPLIFPASYLLDKKGLRLTTILGTLSSAIGAWIKVIAVAPDRFIIAFVGQTLCGISQIFLLSVPPKLAAVWFGADQVSTACSLAVFGNQFGVATGFLLPPMLIKNHDSIEDIGSDLSVFCYGMAGTCTVIFLLVVFIFEKEPKMPPSIAQALQQEGNTEGFTASIKRLMANKGFILLLLSYGINLGVFNALCTLLNQLILTYFENAEVFAGRVGLVIVLAGMLGSVVGGIVLDKTHKYKETTLFLYVFSLVGMFAFAYTLSYQSQLIVYSTSILLGFCLGGYMPVGFELAMELTYPEPEGTSAGILLFVCQTVSFFFTLFYSWLMNSIGDVWSNMILCGTLAIGTVLTVLIPPYMRRQAAVKTKMCQDLVTN